MAAKHFGSSIGNRAVLFVLLSIVLSGAGGFSYSFYRLAELSEENSRRNEAFIIEKSKESLRNLVTLPYEIIRSHADGSHNTELLESVFDVVGGQIQAVLADSSLGLEEKRERVRTVVSLARFDKGENYVWINDRRRVVFHPNSKIVGLDIGDKSLADAGTGEPFLRRAVERSLAEASRQTVFEYMWPRPGSNKPEPKVALMRHIPELDWFIGAGAYKSGLVELQKRRAVEAIKRLRLDDGNYFWINDDTQPVPRMVVHPTVPALDGKILDSDKFNCATSMLAGIEGIFSGIPGGKKNLFQAMIEVVKTQGSRGEGFVAYDWPRPKGDGATQELYPKLSYVRLYEPWGWVIGMGTYIDDIKATVARDKNAFDQGRRRVMMDTSAMGGACLAVTAILLWLFFRRNVNRPLAGVMRFAARVAGGDLSARTEGYYPCETGTLKEAIEDMVGTLKEKMAEADMLKTQAEADAEKVRTLLAETEAANAEAERAKREGMRVAALRLEDIAALVATASEELSGRIDGASRGTELQRDRISETATAMEEMNATVLEVAKNAGQAAESAEGARCKALEGAEVVRQAVAAIDSVQEQAKGLKDNMAALGRQAQDIGRVMEVISDIADQTNLLALNAAIEAARAGDAGRGFAVVADEVRKLAEKTMQATREVGQAIGSIQQDTRASVAGVDEAARAIEKATALARSSGHALDEIVALVDTATDQVRAIAAASEQQSTTSDEITRAVEDINRLSADTAEAMEESAGAVTGLASQAKGLQDVVIGLKKDG